MDLRSAHTDTEKSSAHLPLSLDPRFQSTGACIYRQLTHLKTKKKASRETSEEEWDRRDDDDDDDDDEGVMEEEEEEEEEEDTRQGGTKTGSNTLNSKYVSWSECRLSCHFDLNLYKVSYSSALCQPY